MAAPARLFDRNDRPQEDHFVHLDGVTWDDYQRLLEIRGDHSAPRGERYEPASASEVLPGIDLEQLASLIDRPTTSQSMREYRDALRKP